MKRSNKKGFTIVELVIVIAIIAILAAVLIPTFASLIQKANESKDTQLVKNLNTALAADNKEHKTMTEALAAAAEFGYDVGKINASATGNEILWDSENDVFCYLKGENVEYIPETNLKTGSKPADYKLWKIYTEAPETQKYSIYWNSDKAFDKELTVGFDAGNNSTITTLTYKGVSTAQSVTLRTNGGTLTVDAANDTVNHYGKLGSVLVTAVALNSYHELGEVQGNIVVASGRVEVSEEGTVLGTVLVAGNDVKVDVKNNNTKVAVKNGVTLSEGSVTGTTANSANVVETVEQLNNALSKDGTIVLGNDLSANIVIAAGKNIVLNLNGYKLNGTVTINGMFTLEGTGTIEASGRALFINKGATATINGGKIKSKDFAINLGQCAGKNAEKAEGGTLVFNNGEVEAKEACIDGWYSGTITINGGLFTSHDNFVIGTNGSPDHGNNKITINGGTFNGNIKSQGYIACGIYLANNDVLIVNGGTFNVTNGCGILVRSGNATVGKDVVINLNNENGGITSGRVGDSNITISPSIAVVVDKRSGYPGGAPELTNNSNYTEFTIVC